jgi:hypothetical protein
MLISKSLMLALENAPKKKLETKKPEKGAKRKLNKVL